VNKSARSRAITSEEFDRIVNAVAKVRKLNVGKWRLFLRGLWLSGLRINAALNLSWDEDAPI
jgi:hypothetical protein